MIRIRLVIVVVVALESGNVLTQSVLGSDPLGRPLDKCIRLL
jgi:hypothetical protein